MYMNSQISPHQLVIPRKSSMRNEFLTQFPSSQKPNCYRRHPELPIKRAVVIGVSYLCQPAYHLEGTANDATLFAHALVHLLDFDPKNIILMRDGVPDDAYFPENIARQYGSGGSTDTSSESSSESSKTSKSHNSMNSSNRPIPSPSPFSECSRKSTESQSTSSSILKQEMSQKIIVHIPIKTKKISRTLRHPYKQIWPTRLNILKSITWLIRDTKPGDVLIFYFAGHGIQIENETGYMDEGYDEALLPCDFDLSSEGNNNNVLKTIQLKELLLKFERFVQLTIILDCSGGQTILDPAGTLNGWTYIKGVKQEGLWPFLTNPTNKMQRAVYNKEIWSDPNMQAQFVRPRYIPGTMLADSTFFSDPILLQVGTSSFKISAFCLAAAPFSQCAIEASFLSVGIIHRHYGIPVTQSGKPVIHGVFTYCLVNSLKELLYSSETNHFKPTSFKSLISRIQIKIRDFKENLLFKLDQIPELTVYTGGAASPDDYFAVSYFDSSSSSIHINDELPNQDNNLKDNFMVPEQAILELCSNGPFVNNNATDFVPSYIENYEIPSNQNQNLYLFSSTKNSKFLYTIPDNRSTSVSSNHISDT